MSWSCMYAPLVGRLAGGVFPLAIITPPSHRGSRIRSNFHTVCEGKAEASGPAAVRAGRRAEPVRSCTWYRFRISAAYNARDQCQPAVLDKVRHAASCCD